MSLLKSRTAVITLSSIMAIRMLGLFMILPVFSVYAVHMRYATPTLIGITLGIYGLTQAIFQIPFGMLSDHLGRKPMIIFGLCLLFIGSVIAANSQSIYLLLFARALQGAGAIGSTVLALLSDLTRDESRTKAMAFMGLSIGFSFTIAMIAGPVINHWFHLSGIFWATTVLSVIAMGLLVLTPTPPKPLKTSAKIKEKFSSVLHNKQLLQLDFGIFCLHTILTALFIAIPILLTHEMHLSQAHQIMLYLTVLIVAFIVALPFIIIAEKKRKMTTVFCAAIAVIFAASTGLCFFHHNLAITATLLFVFFTAFTLLEATLPSSVSKIAPIQNKGAAMGVYSSSQFFGIFVGGSLGGFIFSQAHLSGVFAMCAVIALIWFVFALTMKQPPYLSTLTFPLRFSNDFYQSLLQLPGVAEIAIVSNENLLYVKINKQKISEPELRNAIEVGNL